MTFDLARLPRPPAPLTYPPTHPRTRTRTHGRTHVCVHPSGAPGSSTATGLTRNSRERERGGNGKGAAAEAMSFATGSRKSLFFRPRFTHRIGWIQALTYPCPPASCSISFCMAGQDKRGGPWFRVEMKTPGGARARARVRARGLDLEPQDMVSVVWGCCAHCPYDDALCRCGDMIAPPRSCGGEGDGVAVGARALA